MDPLIQEYNREKLKGDRPAFAVGDTVRVSTRIMEGEKERIQMFQGTVIARKGSGLSETFSLHRVSYGEGMERVFLLHSPRIVKIEVVKQGEVRRSKLYYLRGRTGKKAKVKERIGGRSKAKKIETTPSFEQVVSMHTDSSATEAHAPETLESVAQE
jgi:large subunit ribosomal protein L19